MNKFGIDNCIRMDNGEIWCTDEFGNVYKVDMSKVPTEKVPPCVIQELIAGLHKRIGGSV